MNQQPLEIIKSAITAIPDYPKPGIMFRDITSLVGNPLAFSTAITLLVDHYKDKNIDKVVGIESRGFIFAAPVALALNCPFILVRKLNKLPREKISQYYQLEYGQDCLEIHTDSISQNDNVLVVDDLLATGGTVEASIKLINRLGGKVKHTAFAVSLPALNGEQRLSALGTTSFSLVSF